MFFFEGGGGGVGGGGGWGRGVLEGAKRSIKQSIVFIFQNFFLILTNSQTYKFQ